MSYINNYGYRFIRIYVDGKQRKVLEHRYLMEQQLGRKLDTKEHVHHINGDKLDNTLENLEVMTIAEHNRHHFTGIAPKNARWNKGQGKGKTRIPCACEVCGAQVYRLQIQINFNRKHNRKITCSKYCQAQVKKEKHQAS